MRRLITILTTCAVMLSFCSCSALKGVISNGLFLGKAEQGSLSGLDAGALIVAGLNLLEDKRPQTDIYYMTSIKEKVSTEISKALKDTHLFKEIHFSPSQNDDISLSGEIRKFNWSYYNTMISYIPGFNVLPFFGLPSTRTRADVDIYLQIKNNKTGEVVLEFNEAFIKNNSFNMYSFNPDKANTELAACFGVVLNKIKDRILLNKNKILEAVKLEPPKPLKPAEEVKPAEEKNIPVEKDKPQEETNQPAAVSSPAAETKPAENPKVTPPAESVNTEAKPQ